MYLFLNVFIPKCKAIVSQHINQGLDTTDGVYITPDDVYVVWLSKTLQNAKALLSSNVPNGMYYELTYNGNRQEIYMDAYKKIENKVVSVAPKRTRESYNSGNVDFDAFGEGK